MRIARSTLLIVSVACAASLPKIQSQEAKPLRFEVVSVRPSDPKTTVPATVDILPDGIRERNNTLIWLIVYAFDAVIPGTVENEPTWVDDERFDVQAKVAPEDVPRFQALSSEQKRSMLQSVLRERFNLREHTRKKNIRIFYLKVAKDGPKLTESKPDSSGHIQKVMEVKPTGEFIAEGLNMSQIIGDISYFAGRPVIDHTDLKGLYQFDLKWATPKVYEEGASADDNNAPAFFTAVREQLGLKLVPAEATFDAIVIDQIQRPTPN